MDYETIILDKTDEIATITLNRPQKRNAFNSLLLDEFVNATEDAAGDPGVKVIIITGAGSAFCSGNDFSGGRSSQPDNPEAIEVIQSTTSQEKQMLALRKIRKPVIAMVNGPVMGAGLGFCLSCDLIIASENAVFGFGFVKLGLHPEAGLTFLLPRIIGTAKACELLFMGKTLDAKEAERIGLINLVTPQDTLLSTTRELALNMAKGPGIAIGLTKISLFQSWAEGLPAALENEARANAICTSTEDFKEAVRAFRERRPPKFQGK